MSTFIEKSFNKIIIILFVLNIIDTFATIFFVKNNFAKEINPIINYLLQNNIFMFYFFKLIIISLILLCFIRFFYKHINSNLSKKIFGYSMLVCVLLYVGAIISHAYIFLQVINV